MKTRNFAAVICLISLTLIIATIIALAIRGDDKAIWGWVSAFTWCFITCLVAFGKDTEE